VDFAPSPTVIDADGGLLPIEEAGARHKLQMTLATPSSCASASRRQTWALSPSTPDAERSDLKLIRGDVGAILFDFDGTLTATPGDSAARSQKDEELVERAGLLGPFLAALRDAGITLGIISKSSEATIRGALESAALAPLFDGPIVAKAVGFEGKAGFIEELVCSGALQHLGQDGLHRVLLIDDDVRELDRARLQGIQTHPAPENGGLQAEDFDEILSRLDLELLAQPSPQEPPQPPTCAPTPARSLLADIARFAEEGTGSQPRLTREVCKCEPGSPAAAVGGG